MEGSIRCLHDNERSVHQRFSELVDGICKNHRTSYNLELKCGNSLLNNNIELTKMVVKAGNEVVGQENIVTDDVSVMLGDDFAEFGKYIPIAYYFVGTGNQEKNTNHEHHSSHFNIDEDSLPIGIEMHVRTALEILNN